MTEDRRDRTSKAVGDYLRKRGRTRSRANMEGRVSLVKDLQAGDKVTVTGRPEWGVLTIIETDGVATVRVRGSRGERFRIGRERLERAAEVPGGPGMGLGMGPAMSAPAPESPKPQGVEMGKMERASATLKKGGAAKWTDGPPRRAALMEAADMELLRAFAAVVLGAMFLSQALLLVWCVCKLWRETRAMRGRRAERKAPGQSPADAGRAVH